MLVISKEAIQFLKAFEDDTEEGRQREVNRNRYLAKRP